MTESEIRGRLSAVKCFMLDMDGTFYLGNRLLEGSLDFLRALERTGRSAMFVTNNSSKSADVYVKKLRRMGVEAPFLNVLTSGQAAGQYCLREFAGKRAFLLGNEMLKAELERMGVAIDNENPDYVLIGYDTTLDYEKMTRVCDLVRAGLPYIATHPDFNCPTETGFAPDMGAIMAFIEASAGRRPDVILGKPYAGIVEEALRMTGLQKRELAMVGDRLYTDISCGYHAGVETVLVLSGEATEEEAKAYEHQPDYVMSSVDELHEAWSKSIS